MYLRLILAVVMACALTLALSACAQEGGDGHSSMSTSSNVTANASDANRAAASIRGPMLVVQGGDKPDAGDKPEAGGKPATLRISKVKIDVTIVAGIARTTQLLTFANDTDRVLQGELLFPLPVGSTLSGYGLDVDGVIVDAVAVEKNRARVIFENEVRKGVDPGLAEWTQGNVFRTRIYPIPAKGTRSVKVVYLSELPLARVAQQQRGEHRLFTLPLNFTDKLDIFELRINMPTQPILRMPGANPWLIEGDRLLGGLALASDKDNPKGSIGTLAGEQTSVVGQVVVGLPATGAQSTLVEGWPGAREAFFLIEDKPQLPEFDFKHVQPQHIAIFWDASLSREDVDHSGELGLVERHLKALGQIEVDVVVFRDRMEPPHSFTVKNGDASAVVKYLKALTYDGATNLSELIMPGSHMGFYSADLLARARMRMLPPYDYHLLFTDGMATLGQPPLPPPPSGLRPSGPPNLTRDAVSSGVPAYVFSSGTIANHGLLRHLATTTSGRYIDLSSANLQTAVDAINAPAWRLEHVEYDAAEVADVTPATGYLEAGRMTVAGRLLADSATVTLVYEHTTGQILRSEHALQRTATLAAARDTADRGSASPDEPLVPILWAQRRIAQLAIFPDQSENADALLDLGRRFGLVTPNTSLLVLETLEQHLQYGIAPAKSRPEMLAAFEKQIEERTVAKQRSAAEKLDSVVTAWKEKVAWWEKRFEYPKDLKIKADKQDGQLGTEAATGRVSGPLDAAPSSLPAPVTTPAPLAVEADASRSSNGTALQAQVAAQAVTGDAGAHRILDERGGRGGGAGGALFGDDALVETAEQAPFAGQESESTVTHPATIQLAKVTEGQEPPYLAPIRKAMMEVGVRPGEQPGIAYAIYLEQRKEHGRKPAFYLDVAHLLFEMDAPDKLGPMGPERPARILALRVLSNIAELDLDNPALLRVLGRQYQQRDELDLAIVVFEQVLRLRPEEPQSYRDLALAHAALAQRLTVIGASGPSLNQTALHHYTQALRLLDEVVRRPWHGRFANIELIALSEANDILALLKHQPTLDPITVPIDPRLQTNLDSDLRIVLEWDADATDMDLWVTEPSGERCLYSHNRTTIGGWMSNDMTQGYGPEEYFVRRAMPGQYKIQANYYGSSQQTLSGAVTLQATLITNFGRPDEKRQQRTFRLGGKQEVVEVGSVTMGDGKN